MSARGEMPEWPNGIDSKSIVAAMPPRVRIPVSPPHIPLKPAPVAGLSFLVCAGPYFGACEGSHRVAIREASANVTAFFSFLGLTRLGVLAVVVRSWPSSPVLCVSRLAQIAQFCAVRIAHFAQFPNQLNPPQSLVLLGLPANEQQSCAAPVVIRFWMNCAICAEWRSARSHPDERGSPGRLGGAGSAMSQPLRFEGRA